MNILLFGITREIIDEREVKALSDELSQLETVGNIKAFLGEKYPGLKELSSLKVAVNQEFAMDSTKITKTDEIALIPPVSGG